MKLSWWLEWFSDSDWRGDMKQRKRISGWTLILNDCLISWGSRQKWFLNISTRKSELVASSEVYKEVIFVRNILEFLTKPVNYLITINVENVGDIFPWNNGSGKCMRHVNIRGFYIRDYVENQEIKIHFVKSEENMADPYTKNVNSKCFHDNNENYMFHNNVSCS